MGRPPKEIEDKLCKSVNIKLTIDDFCNLIDRAEKFNITPTAYARLFDLLQDYGDLLLLFALLFVAIVQSVAAQTRDSLSLIKTLYYERDVYVATDEDLDELKDLVFRMRADSTLKVHIVGFGDKWGDNEVNGRFSYVRAMYIGDWMRSCRVPCEQIAYFGEGVDSLATSDVEARRVEVSQVITVVIAPEPQSDKEIVEIAEPEKVEIVEV